MSSCPLTRTNLQHKKIRQQSSKKSNQFGRIDLSPFRRPDPKNVKKKQKKLAFHKYCCVILYLAPRVTLRWFSRIRLFPVEYKYKQHMWWLKYLTSVQSGKFAIGCCKLKKREKLKHVCFYVCFCSWIQAQNFHWSLTSKKIRASPHPSQPMKTEEKSR